MHQCAYCSTYITLRDQTFLARALSLAVLYLISARAIILQQKVRHSDLARRDYLVYHLLSDLVK